MDKPKSSYWDPNKTYTEVNKTEDCYEEVAITEMNGKRLTICSRIQQGGLLGVLISSIADIEKGTGKIELLYFHQKRIIGLGKDNIERKLFNAAKREIAKMDPIARGEI
jgi:hypothetical protein